MKKLFIALWCLVILSLHPVSSFAQGSRDTKVVVLQGTVLITARGDGSEVRELLRDGTPKEEPRWSPDGQRIVYSIAGQKLQHPKTHANLVVIAVDNGSQKTIPVLATEADGTIVGGMRFVEESGWYSNFAVFASGSVNPHRGEFRIIDAESSRVVGGYLSGGPFATCAHKGQVAYVTEEEESPGRKTIRIEVNGDLLYSWSDGVDTMIRNFHWSQDCQRLAFTEESDTGVDFVVLHGTTHSTTLEIRRRLPQEILQSLTIARISDSFLLQGAQEALFYDTTEKSLRLAPEVVEKWQQEQRERDEVIKNLGGGVGDWWQPPH